MRMITKLFLQKEILCVRYPNLMRIYIFSVAYACKHIFNSPLYVFILHFKPSIFFTYNIFGHYSITFRFQWSINILTNPYNSVILWFQKVPCIYTCCNSKTRLDISCSVALKTVLEIGAHSSSNYAHSKSFVWLFLVSLILSPLIFDGCTNSFNQSVILQHRHLSHMLSTSLCLVKHQMDETSV